MSPVILGLILLAFATILGQMLKNTKLMRAINPYRGWIVMGIGLMLIIYIGISGSHPISVPFLLFPILFIIVGLVTLKRDRKTK
ncbi:hypothetical protein [Weissella confusa]